jgi:hypothetical protein
VLIGVAAEILRESTPEKRMAAMFVDSAFGAPIVERLRTLGFDNVHEVSFGSPSPDYHDANWRAYIWRQMKDWLAKGAFPTRSSSLCRFVCRAITLTARTSSSWRVNRTWRREAKHHPMTQTRWRSPSRSP